MVLPLVATALVVVLALGFLGMGAVQAQGLVGRMARTAAVADDTAVRRLVDGLPHATVDIDPPEQRRIVGDVVTVTLHLPVGLPLVGARWTLRTAAAAVVEEAP